MTTNAKEVETVGDVLDLLQALPRDTPVTLMVEHPESGAKGWWAVAIEVTPRSPDLSDGLVTIAATGEQLH